MSDLWLKAGYAYGGREAINEAEIADLAKPLLSTPPKLWMTHAPSFLPFWDGRGEDTGFLGKEFGTDYDFFLLPPIDKARGAPGLVESHITAMLRETSESRALMAYVASGAQGEAWAKLCNGFGVSPRKGAKLEWYPDALSRRTAEVIPRWRGRRL